jgi:hypothetical protein
MVTIALISLGILAGVLVLVVVAYWLLNFSVRRHLRPRYTVFGENLQVTHEWQELSGTKPVLQRGESQHIFLNIPDYQREGHFDFDIKLTDGRTILPEIQVVNSSQQVFDTEDSTRWGSLIGFTVNPRLPNRAEQVILRLRSSETFHCRSIGFTTKRMK